MKYAVSRMKMPPVREYASALISPFIRRRVAIQTYLIALFKRRGVGPYSLFKRP